MTATARGDALAIQWLLKLKYVTWKKDIRRFRGRVMILAPQPLRFLNPESDPPRMGWVQSRETGSREAQGDSKYRLSLSHLVTSNSRLQARLKCRLLREAGTALGTFPCLLCSSHCRVCAWSCGSVCHIALTGQKIPFCSPLTP